MTKEQELELIRIRARARKAQAAGAMRPGGSDNPDFNVGEYASGMLDSITQGATLFAGDEITAFESAVLGRRPGDGTFNLGNYGDTTFGERYDATLAAERAQHKQFQEDYPVSDFAGNVVGGGAAAIATGGVAPASARAAAAAIPGFIKIPATGAIGGGVAGFMGSEGTVEERLPGAAMGAGLGAIAGPAMYAGGRALKAGGQVIQDAYRAAKYPQQTADRALKRAFDADEITAERADIGLTLGGPQAMVPDVGGREVHQLTRELAETPGAMGRTVKAAMDKRAKGETSRVHAAVDKGLSRDNLYASEAEFLEGIAETAVPLYQKAYEEFPSIMTPQLARFLRNDRVKTALDKVSKMLDDEATAASMLPDAPGFAEAVAMKEAIDQAMSGKPGVIEGFSLQTWDRVKRGLDALMEGDTYRNQLTRGLTAEGNAVNSMRRALLDHLDDNTGGKTGAYAKARQSYRGNAEGLDALLDGQKAFGGRMAPERITQAMAKYSEGGREAYLTGFARSVKDAASKANDTASAVKRVFGSDWKRDQIEAAFGGDKIGYAAFHMKMAQELLYSETRAATRASTRAPLKGETADLLRGGFEKIGALGGALLGGSGGLIIAAMRAQAGRAVGRAIYGEKSAKSYYARLANRLIGNNRELSRGVVDAIRTLPKEEQANQLAQILMAAGTLGAGKAAGTSYSAPR